MLLIPFSLPGTSYDDNLASKDSEGPLVQVVLAFQIGQKEEMLPVSSLKRWQQYSIRGPSLNRQQGARSGRDAIKSLF